MQIMSLKKDKEDALVRAAAGAAGPCSGPLSTSASTSSTGIPT
jgi:hypothetical protein